MLQSAEAQRPPPAGPPLHTLPLEVQDASCKPLVPCIMSNT
jgi:hypothetical protein